MALPTLPPKIREIAKPYLRAILAFSLAINVLMLVSPIYMLQVYDRILTTGSYETLGWLSLLALALLAIYGIAEMTRRRLFALAAQKLSELYGTGIFGRFLDERADPRLSRDLADLSRIDNGLRGGALAPLFDLPFVPLYLAALFLVHSLLGILALAGAVALIVGAVIGHRRARPLSEESEKAEALARDFAAGLERQRSAMLAMGIAGRTRARLLERRIAASDAHLASSSVQGATTGFSRSLRQSLQIVILGVGALLAVEGSISAGAIVAGSILMGRLLMPIDQIVGSWSQLQAMGEAWGRISSAVEAEEEGERVVLPRPEAKLALRDMAIGFSQDAPPLVRPVSLDLTGGALVGLVGANGSGKTSLLQTLSGIWRPMAGEVLLDGRAVHDWPSEDRGCHVGYLPQHVELLPGTIAQNIVRFVENADSADLFAAARRAGAHDAIQSLPDGYDSLIGPGGIPLSAGQAKMIGLARAMYGEPPLLLLDEPTAHLDQAASNALISSLGELVEAGTLAIVSTHDPALIRRAKSVLVLHDRALKQAAPETLLAPVPAMSSPAKMEKRA